MKYSVKPLSHFEARCPSNYMLRYLLMLFRMPFTWQDLQYAKLQNSSTWWDVSSCLKYLKPLSNYPSDSAGIFTNFAIKNPIESFLMSSGGSQCNRLGLNLCSRDACVSSNRIPEIPFPPTCGVCRKQETQKISTNFSKFRSKQVNICPQVSFVHQTYVSIGLC